MDSKSIKKRRDLFLLKLSDTEKDLMLNFFIESQILEYGIMYILTGLPFLNGPKLEDISEKPLGALINELEKTKDSSLILLAQQAREFNLLRRDVLHNLLHMNLGPKELISELKDKIILSRKIQNQIEEEFDYVYEAVLDIPYGSIF